MHQHRQGQANCLRRMASPVLEMHRDIALLCFRQASLGVMTSTVMLVRHAISSVAAAALAAGRNRSVMSLAAIGYHFERQLWNQ